MTLIFHKVGQKYRRVRGMMWYVFSKSHSVDGAFWSVPPYKNRSCIFLHCNPRLHSYATLRFSSANICIYWEFCESGCAFSVSLVSASLPCL